VVSRPAVESSPGVPRLVDECAPLPAHIRQIRAGPSFEGRKRRFLAYSFSSRSPNPRHLAVLTRLGFVGAACHPSRRHPGQTAPSSTLPLRQDGGEGLSPPLETQRLTAHSTTAES
jgi:hypothetical protein